MHREDFVRDYMAVRQATFKSNTFISAFQKSGIKPLNPSIFTNEDYALSIPTSTAAYVPESYPTSAISATLTSHNWEDDVLATESESGSSDENYDDSNNLNRTNASSDSDKDSDSNDHGDKNPQSNPQLVPFTSSMPQHPPSPEHHATSMAPIASFLQPTGNPPHSTTRRSSH